MLKHSEIIGKLDPLRKAALVSSALGDEALVGAGLPSAGKVSLAELGKTRGVSYGSAARAWDAELIGGMTGELTAEAGAEGARLFVSPDLRAAIDPRGEGLAEDGCLTGAYGAEMVRAVHAAGGAVGLGKLSVGAEDVAWLDKKESPAAIHDLVEAPFLRATAEEPCDAVFLTPSRAGKGYADTNRVLFYRVLDGSFGAGALAVGEGTAPVAESVTLLRDGGAVLGGAALPVARAVRRWERLERYLAEGSISAREAEDALRDGTALNGETLDRAADDVADFVLRTNARTVTGAPARDARRRLAAECIVLLKNRKVLPLKAGTKVAVLGDAYADLSALSEKFEVTGSAAGYDRDADRSDERIPEAVRAAEGAQVLLLFLTPARDGKSFELPANRLALFDALAGTGKPVVALVAGDAPVDLAFDGRAAATLLLPPDGPFAGDALARVLCGEECPSGKLVRTAYDGADAYFRTLKEERDAGAVRIGSFLGYRRYDTAEEEVRYPFGFGLSYTKFEYSKLTLAGDAVSFTLKNTGGCDGSETVQIYVGAPSSTHAVPRKELKAFRKVFLRAGESKRVTVDLPASAYASYDPRTRSENVEAGVYRVFVCASSLDERLQGTRTLEGVVREPERESAADYVPNGDYGETVVRRENRIAGGTRAPVPKTLRTCRRIALFAVPVAALLFFLLLTMLILSYALSYTLLFTVDETAAEWGLYIIAVCVLGLLPLLGSLSRKRLSRVRKFALVVCPVLLFACFILGALMLSSKTGLVEEIVFRVLACLSVGVPVGAAVAAVIEHEVVRSKCDTNRWEKYYVEAAREVRVTPEAQFEEAFLNAEAKREKPEPAAVREEKEEEPEPPQLFAGDADYGTMLRELMQFTAERGTEIGEETLRDWLAALSSARLILVPAGDGAAVCAAVAEYFGKRAYIDNAEQYVRCEDLFSQWKDGERATVRSNFSLAVAAAKRENAYLHTVLVRHVDPVRLKDIFLPVADVLARRCAAVSLPDGTDVLLPENLRIVAEVEGDAVNAPAGIAEVAAVLSPVCKAVDPAEKRTPLAAVGYGALAALAASVRDAYPLGEEAWKRVDEFAARCKGVRMGNRLFVKTELHASVVAACGGTEDEAIDGALAAEAIPCLAAAEKDRGELAAALEAVFGERAARSRAALGTTGGGERK